MGASWSRGSVGSGKKSANRLIFQEFILLGETMGEPSMDWGAPLKGAQLSERQDSLWGEEGL